MTYKFHKFLEKLCPNLDPGTIAVSAEWALNANSVQGELFPKPCSGQSFQGNRCVPHDAAETIGYSKSEVVVWGLYAHSFTCHPAMFTRNRKGLNPGCPARKRGMWVCLNLTLSQQF